MSASVITFPQMHLRDVIYNGMSDQRRSELHLRVGNALEPGYSTTLTGNAAVVSDYMFRGLTQTWGRPAIQGGGDLAMKNGFAAGFWMSSISHKSYPGGAMELDLYASYGANFNPDWSWRAGLARLRACESR